MLKLDSKDRVTMPANLLNSVPSVKEAKSLMILGRTELKKPHHLFFEIREEGNTPKGAICFKIVHPDYKHRIHLGCLSPTLRNGNYSWAIKDKRLCMVKLDT